MKEIREELLDLTETYQKNVLERTDELEQLGQLEAGHSKQFSKKILDLSKLVPPAELADSIANLETQIKQKLADMDLKIKKLKSKTKKKKKKVEKKTIQQRMAVLSAQQKLHVEGGLEFCNSTKQMEQLSTCCPGYTSQET